MKGEDDARKGGNIWFDLSCFCLWSSFSKLGSQCCHENQAVLFHTVDSAWTRLVFGFLHIYFALELLRSLMLSSISPKGQGGCNPWGAENHHRKLVKAIMALCELFLAKTRPIPPAALKGGPGETRHRTPRVSPQPKQTREEQWPEMVTNQRSLSTQDMEQ